MRLVFIGFGSVGSTLAEIFVNPKQFPKYASTDFSEQCQVVGIVTLTRGTLINPNGIDLARALREVKHTEGPTPGKFNLDNPDLDAKNRDALQIASQIDYDILVEISSLSIENRGEPAISHIRIALNRNKHVVSANKGPLAFAAQELLQLAQQNNVSFLYESTMMDGAPVFSMAKHCLRGCRVLGLSGILNSTTNFVLEQLGQVEIEP